MNSFVRYTHDIRATSSDTEIIVISSMSCSRDERKLCDEYFKLDEDKNDPDGGKFIANFIKKRIENPALRKLSEKDLLESKLRILHNCLMPEGIPEQISEELYMYAKAFEQFKTSVKGCTDCFDKAYINALRDFRNKLLDE